MSDSSPRRTPRVPRTVWFEKVVPAVLIALAIVLVVVLVVLVVWTPAP